MSQTSLSILIGCALAAPFLFAAPSPARGAGASLLPSAAPLAAAPDGGDDAEDDDADDDEDDDDDDDEKDEKDEKKGKDDDEGKEGKKDDDDSGPEPGVEDFADPGEDFSKPSPLEHDRTSPRFVAKDVPSFVMVRPGAGAKGARPPSKKASGKDAPVDGSLWGFVDIEARKRRIGGRYDQEITRYEKMMNDEQASEEEREQARKQVVYYKAQKKKQLNEFDKVRCRVELVANYRRVFFQVSSQDWRTPQLMRKKLSDEMKDRLLGQGVEVSEERPESWMGKKINGHTFIGQAADSAGKPVYRRRTYFFVPKPKNAGTSLVFFDCVAAKDALTPEIERAFELFIRGTTFGN